MQPVGLEELDTGYYQLIGIVSHKGRTARNLVSELRCLHQPLKCYEMLVPLASWCMGSRLTEATTWAGPSTRKRMERTSRCVPSHCDLVV